MLIGEGGNSNNMATHNSDLMPVYSASATRKTGGHDDLTIGQVARLTGLSAKTIRYYEEIGLLPAAGRTANRYRRYGQADLNRLRLLQRIRLLGVPLSAARDLLAATSDARCAEVRTDLLGLVDQRLQTLDQEIAALRGLRDAVERYSRALAGCHPGESELFSSCDDIRCVVEPDDLHCCDEENPNALSSCV